MNGVPNVTSLQKFQLNMLKYLYAANKLQSIVQLKKYIYTYRT